MAVMGKRSLDYLLLLFITLALILLAARPNLAAEGNPETPSLQNPTVHQCRGHIENALKEFIVHQSPEEAVTDAKSSETSEQTPSKEESGSAEDQESHDTTKSDESKENEADDGSDETGEKSESKEDTASEEHDEKQSGETEESGEDTKEDDDDKDKKVDESGETEEEQSKSEEKDDDDESDENQSDDKESDEQKVGSEGTDEESDEKESGSVEKHGEESGETNEEEESGETAEKDDDSDETGEKKDESDETGEKKDETEEKVNESGEKSDESGEGDDESSGDKETDEDESKETAAAAGQEGDKSGESKESGEDTGEDVDDAKSAETGEDASKGSDEDEQAEAGKSGSAEDDSTESGEHADTGESETEEKESEEEEQEETEPIELRSRAHVDDILGLDDESMASTIAAEKPVQITLRELKKMYDLAVRPMEVLYKFKDISNRFVGDAEIFSKPMLLFMGPWSSGKSAMINYLLDIEDTRSALKTGAEPQSNGFTVLMYGDTEQTMDGMEIAADWAFSTLQKFGESFLDRLQGLRLPNNLLRKVTIVDTPGIIENRKQQDRSYPFNDACQWFIDRADIIYVVFDPTKLDMGLEMEALFDQLKGREAQVRIILNKADTVSPQELMQVQSTLLWNLSPLLGSSEPPTIFVGTLWSHEFLPGSPETLFNAQESALLQDLRQTIDGRVESKISFTRRHAVRVRNHAKMVDCYLNTYYNHKSFFSNKKKVADEIIENPQNYHIYEGLSTLTNVSRYDLPDPDIYRDFFKVNPLYDFKLLASTCSYFKGCPLDKLDVAIAYDLPELMGKYRKSIGSGNVSEGTGGKR